VRVADVNTRAVSVAAPLVRLPASAASTGLAGFDAPVDAVFAPGQAVGVRWYLNPATSPQPVVSLEYADSGGRTVGAQQVRLAPDWSPVSGWRAGWTYAPIVDLSVPARAPSGPLTVRLAGASVPGGKPIDLFTLRVQAPDRVLTAPAPEHSTGARFGQFALLAGYDGPASGTLALRPGDQVRVRLHWQATGETDTAYKLFVHLVGPDGKIHGQADAPPLGGRRPTPGWVPGEWLADPLEVTVTADAPVGVFTLRLGLYEETTGKRAALTAGGQGDYVDLLTFEVRR
jgi:hypothetical protein